MKRRDFLTSMAAAGVYLVADAHIPYGVLVSHAAQRQDGSTPAPGGSWPRPVVLPIPTFTAGVQQPYAGLDGRWEINAAPPDQFWADHASSDRWKQIVVPGQADMQGVAIKRDVAYAYRTTMKIPADFRGKRIFLRFESVSGIATPYINGVALEQHQGGFTIWSREITDHASAGSTADIAIGILDPVAAHWSCGFDYGGICRSVALIATPHDYLTRLHVHADLDREYRDAVLRIETEAQISGDASCRVELRLTDPHGHAVALPHSQIEITNEMPLTTIQVSLPAAIKWDAEHPNLYMLEARFFVGGRHEQTLQKKFGVREIEVSGNKVLVNGMEIKLRGGGRFDSNPKLGHTLSTEQCEEEVRIFKDANVNYLRPACYPASEAYLEACDRYGMYVEGETSVTFTRGTESNPDLTPLFMDQMAAMIEANRDHPCILHWSLGNESSYGINIAKTFEYAQRVDPSRPVLFSWSHSIPPEDPLPYNLYSYHYPNTTDDLGKPGVAVFNGGKLNRPIPEMPVLHDEYGHGPCYDLDELKRDPNVHNFWGESIKIFWERMFQTPGCLGGSIWALVDETAEGTRVYGWGMVDLWRRKKPEYWVMKKAYSPVRLNYKEDHVPEGNASLRLPVSNWHNHANLNELKVRWSVASEKGELPGPDLAPRADGEFVIPRRAWRAGEKLSIVFSDGERDVDEYLIPVGISSASTAQAEAAPGTKSPELSEDADRFTITGDNFQLFVNKHTGMLQSNFRGTKLIEDGPYFHLIGADLDPWELDTVAAKREDKFVTVNLAGHHGGVQVTYDLEIRGEGLINLRYTLVTFDITGPATKLVPWNRTDAGGFAEVGVSFTLTSQIDRLEWKRAGLYSVYPDDHIGRNEGVALRTKAGDGEVLGEMPNHPWAEDEQDFNLFGADDKGGRGTNDFRSMKEYVEHASARAGANGPRVYLQSDRTQAIRLEVVGGTVDGDVKLIVNDLWNYTHLGLGNYMKSPITVKSGYTGRLQLRLES
jgi:hypothetical protein